MMKMRTKNFDLFTTHVREYDLTKHVNLIEAVRKKNTTTHNLVVGGSSSYDQHSFLLEDEDMKPLAQDIHLCLDDYMNEVGDPDERFEILNSWFNIMTGEGKLHEHFHKKSVLSGAYYMKLPENSSQLYFKGQWKYHKKFNVPIKEGHLYLFPSYLIHGGTSSTNLERIVISFNTSVRY